jgi:hypothetical protein
LAPIRNITFWPSSSSSFDVGKNGELVIVVALSKEALVKAPEFKATEKTTFDKVRDSANDLGQSQGRGQSG